MTKPMSPKGTAPALGLALGLGLRVRLLLAAPAALLLPVALTSIPSTPALAVEPGEMLDDPALEQRARELSKNLRCLVCKNQSIDDSDAELAKDLRLLVRRRLTQGDSNEEVMRYVTDRYGDFVLLKPPVRPETYVLWYGPIVIALLGVIGVLMFYRSRRREVAAAASGSVAASTGAEAGTAPGASTTESDLAPPPLSAEEQAELDRLLARDSAGFSPHQPESTPKEGA